MLYALLLTVHPRSFWPYIHLALSVVQHCVLRLQYHSYTIFLFTYTDYKTILIPVGAFATVAAPVCSLPHFIYGMSWIWFHLLQCNISNQYRSVEEDIVNKPWRPLPAGRISFEEARVLRWSILVCCMLLSLRCGGDVCLVSIWLTATMVAYDECQLSGHWLGKNVLNISGYISFEVGATKIMGSTSSLDNTATRSMLLSALIIFSMIHMQDFPDIAGDKALRRITLPIRYPNASRFLSAAGCLVWSAILTETWRLGPVTTCLFCALGMHVAWRNYHMRLPKDDAATYRIFNLWLLFAHLLPINARTGILVW